MISKSRALSHWLAFGLAKRHAPMPPPWSEPVVISRTAKTTRASAHVALLLGAVAPVAHGQADTSFRLSAGFQDLPKYFPAYLANGYFSTLSTPKGTEATPA